jgi:transcription elongation factor GreA
MSSEPVWLTPAALQRLRDELANLTDGRDINDDQRARVAELSTLIARAEASSKPDDGLVEPGMRVTVTFDDDGSTAEFIFGSRTLLGLDDSLDVAVYSPESPLGAAIAGKYVGDTVTVSAPAGERSLTIVQAVPAT